ncbi:MAG: GGDEF domain-containing protein [bacterium]
MTQNAAGAPALALDAASSANANAGGSSASGTSAAGAASWARWNRRAHELIERGFRAFGGEPREIERWEDYARYMTAVTWAGFAAACLAINLAFWGFDPWIFGADHARLAIFAAWRGIFLATTVVAIVTFRRIARRRGSPFRVGVGMLLGFSAVTFGLMGMLGGPDRPWIHTGMTFPLATMLFVVPVLTRLALSLATAAVVLLAAFLPHPEYLQAPFVTNLVGMTFGIALLGTAMGHAFYVLLERNFEQRHALTRLAYFDPLTEVASRARLLELAESEVARAVRYRRPLSLLVVDVDHFKRVNDTYGHVEGDRVLRAIGRALRTSVRASDLVGRLGGEEFAVVLPESDARAAGELAERLRLAVREVPAPGATDANDGGASCSVTVGGSQLVVGAEGLRELLIRADRALYDGKRAGRDRVVIA